MVLICMNCFGLWQARNVVYHLVEILIERFVIGPFFQQHIGLKIMTEIIPKIDNPRCPSKKENRN